MAPPRRILRQQLEILMDFLEENKDMSNGLPPGAPISQQMMREKWAGLAKALNNVPEGSMKTPDGWKKYWFEWRHKCRKKAANARRYQSGPYGGPTRFVPLNDLEVRVLQLGGKGSVTPNESSSKQLENFLAEDSDSEPLENIKIRTAQSSKKPRGHLKSRSKSITDDDSRSTTPPPKWALEYEERRIAAEERMAEAMESIAATMKAQVEHKSAVQERIADALTAIATSSQDLNTGMQEAIHHLRQLHPNANGPDLKTHVFL